MNTKFPVIDTKLIQLFEIITEFKIFMISARKRLNKFKMMIDYFTKGNPANAIATTENIH